MASDSILRAGAAEASFGWAEFSRLIATARGSIVQIALITVALTAIWMVLTPSRYDASAVVMLDQQKNTVADSSSVLTAPPPDPAAVQNQIQILTSRDLAAKVVAGQKLAEDAEFNPALNGPGLKARLLTAIGLAPPPAVSGGEAAVDAFLKSVDAAALGLSTSIEVSVTARDPDKAARLANVLVETFVAEQIAAKRTASRQAAAWLNARITQLAAQLEEEEIAVERYKSEHNLIDSGQAASLIQQQLATINAQIVAAQSQLAEKQASLRRAQSLMGAGRAADLSQILSSELMVKLHTQAAEIVRTEADLSARYGTNHPKLIAVRSQKRDLDAKINQEAARLTGSIANDVAVARAHLGALQASLRRTGRESSGDNLARVTLNALSAKAATTRQTYEAFVAKLRGVQDQDAIQTPEARIISHAAPPSAPSSPRRALFIAASLPLGAMLGVLLALIRLRLAPAGPDRSPRTEPGFVPPSMSLPPILTELPAARVLAAADAVLDSPASPYASALAGLGMQLLPRGGLAICLCGPVADPAQAVLALGLARAAAGRGLPAVVIETGAPFLLPGLRRPATGGGLAELLNGRTRLEQAMVRDPRANVYILPAGAMANGRTGWLHLARMRELLAYFRKSGFVTVIDAPPISNREAASLAALCDRAVLVADAHLPQDRLAAPLDGFCRATPNVAGLIRLR